MNKIITSKQALLTGTAIIWGAVLIGVTLLTGSEDRALDWQLMWVIVGGFLVHNIMLNAFFKNYKDK